MNLPWEEAAKKQAIDIDRVATVIYSLSQAGFIFKVRHSETWLWELFEMEEKANERFAAGVALSEEHAYSALASTASVWTNHGVKLSAVSRDE